jgi:hypothetical protein
MKIAATATMMVMAGMAARAGETMQAKERTATVCIDAGVGYRVTPQAQMITSKMFAGIGVTIAWRHPGPDCPAEVIRIRLTDQTPSTLNSGALAYALPYDGKYIRVFYDRIYEARGTAPLPRLLAHVIAHEITHVLQGIDRHSDEGVMRARWDERDFTHMAVKPLPFADEDIDLIYRGLAGRAARELLAMNAAPAMVAAK